MRCTVPQCICRLSRCQRRCESHQDLIGLLECLLHAEGVLQPINRPNVRAPRGRKASAIANLGKCLVCIRKSRKRVLHAKHDLTAKEQHRRDQARKLNNGWLATRHPRRSRCVSRNTRYRNDFLDGVRTTGPQKRKLHKAGKFSLCLSSLPPPSACSLVWGRLLLEQGSHVVCAARDMRYFSPR